MNGYEIFLMVELARIKGIIPKELEYDLTWEKGIELYNEFYASTFNDESKGEHECIEAFLNAHKDFYFAYNSDDKTPLRIPDAAHKYLVDNDYVFYDGQDWFYDSCDLPAINACIEHYKA